MRQWALVTGAAKRIGRAIALELAKRGYGIVVHYYRSAEDAELTAVEIRRGGGEAHTIQADLGEDGGPRLLFRRALEKTGRIDILVNSAGSYRPGSAYDTGRDDFLGSYTLNTLAPFELCMTLREQQHRAAAVIMLDSRIGDYAFDHVAYLAAKQSAADLLRVLAVELAPLVRVNAVAPGMILPPDDAPNAFEGLERSNPLERIGTVDEVVDAVLFLLHAEYTTGQIIYVDGGRHLGSRLDPCRRTVRQRTGDPRG